MRDPSKADLARCLICGTSHPAALVLTGWPISDCISHRPQPPPIAAAHTHTMRHSGACSLDAREDNEPTLPPAPHPSGDAHLPTLHHPSARITAAPPLPRPLLSSRPVPAPLFSPSRLPVPAFRGERIKAPFLATSEGRVSSHRERVPRARSSPSAHAQHPRCPEGGRTGDAASVGRCRRLVVGQMDCAHAADERVPSGLGTAGKVALAAAAAAAAHLHGPVLVEPSVLGRAGS